MIFARVSGSYINIKYKILKSIFLKSVCHNKLIQLKLVKTDIFSLIVYNIIIGYIKYILFKYNIITNQLMQYNWILPKTLIINNKHIKKLQFNQCITIQTVIMPNVEVINSDAFRNCFSLKHIQISKNVKLIDSNAFKNCISLQTVEFI